MSDRSLLDQLGALRAEERRELDQLTERAHELSVMSDEHRSAIELRVLDKLGLQPPPASVARARSLRRRLAVWSALPLAAAASMWLWFGMKGPEFRSRGASGVVLEVGCRDAPLSACPSGSILLFRASGAGEMGFLAAWAVAEASGERIWYFPTDDGATPSVAPQAGAQTFSQGIRLDAAHPPGRYRVHVVLSKRPLTRQEVTARPANSVIADAEADVEVTP